MESFAQELQAEGENLEFVDEDEIEELDDYEIEDIDDPEEE
jgi:hypothetical protein